MNGFVHLFYAQILAYRVFGLSIISPKKIIARGEINKISLNRVVTTSDIGTVEQLKNDKETCKRTPKNINIQSYF